MKIKKINKLYKYALAITSASVLSFSAQAQELRFALGFPAGVPLEAAKAYSKAVSDLTNKKLSVRVYELSLLNHSEMSAGIGQGIADVGYLLTAYSPSDYPYSNMGADMSMKMALDDVASGKEGMAYSGAMLEYILLNCPECLNEFKKNNQVYTSVVSTPAYGMFCNKPVKNVQDLSGKRIRISGAPWARWVRNFNASPVALPIGEVYEALSQGVIDCTLVSAPELTNFNLVEVVKDINMAAPGGLYAAGGSSTLNRDRWNSFDEKTKLAMLKAGSVMSSYITFLYQEQANKDLVNAKKRGINMIEPDPGLIDASRAFVNKDLAFIPEFYVKEYKINPERAKQLTEKMSSLIDKWKLLVKDINNPDDLTQLYWDQVYSKLDPKSYASK